MGKWAALLLGWWMLLGEYATREQCEQDARQLVLPPFFEFVRCVNLPWTAPPPATPG